MGKSMIPTNVIPALVEAVKQAERETWEAFRDGDLFQEPKITSAIGGNIKIRCNDIFKKKRLNIEVTFKDFSDRSRSSEEPLYGADLGLTIRVNSNNNMKTYGKVKSVLIQSKFPYNSSKKEIEESLGKMIGIAGAGKHGSFIAVYNKSGVKVSTSWDIENAGYDINSANGESLETFFNKFLSCKHGKRGFDARKLKLIPKSLIEFIVN